MITNFDKVLKVNNLPTPNNVGKYEPNVLYLVLNDNKTFTMHCTSDDGSFLYNQSALPTPTSNVTTKGNV